MGRVREDEDETVTGRASAEGRPRQKRRACVRVTDEGEDD